MRKLTKKASEIFRRNPLLDAVMEDMPPLPLAPSKPQMEVAANKASELNEGDDGCRLPFFSRRKRAQYKFTVKAPDALDPRETISSSEQAGHVIPGLEFASSPRKSLELARRRKTALVDGEVTRRPTIGHRTSSITSKDTTPSPIVSTTA